MKKLWGGASLAIFCIVLLASCGNGKKTADSILGLVSAYKARVSAQDAATQTATQNAQKSSAARIVALQKALDDNGPNARVSNVLKKEASDGALYSKMESSGSQYKTSVFTALDTSISNIKAILKDSKEHTPDQLAYMVNNEANQFMSLIYSLSDRYESDLVANVGEFARTSAQGSRPLSYQFLGPAGNTPSPLMVRESSESTQTFLSLTNSGRNYIYAVSDGAVELYNGLEKILLGQMATTDSDKNGSAQAFQWNTNYGGVQPLSADMKSGAFFLNLADRVHPVASSSDEDGIDHALYMDTPFTRYFKEGQYPLSLPKLHALYEKYASSLSKDGMSLRTTQRGFLQKMLMSGKPASELFPTLSQVISPWVSTMGLALYFQDAVTAEADRSETSIVHSLKSSAVLPLWGSYFSAHVAGLELAPPSTLAKYPKDYMSSMAKISPAFYKAPKNMSYLTSFQTGDFEALSAAADKQLKTGKFLLVPYTTSTHVGVLLVYQVSRDKNSSSGSLQYTSFQGFEFMSDGKGASVTVTPDVFGKLIHTWGGFTIQKNMTTTDAATPDKEGNAASSTTQKNMATTDAATPDKEGNTASSTTQEGN